MTAASMRCCDLLRRALLLAAGLLLAAPALAHKVSDAYLQLASAAHGIELRWDIALRDLDAAIDLDANGDGRLTWGEIKAAWPRIDAYALPRLAIDGCPLALQGRGLERRADGAYAVLHLAAPCALPARPRVAYSLLAGVDATHRGLLRIERPGQGVELVVLDPAHGPVTVSGAAEQGRQTPSFLHEGVLHILTGYDHVMFLICLMLPAVMRRTPRGWEPVGSLGQAIWPILGIVTSFTLAHSITLGLAASKVVSLPSSVIEPAIAATIVVAAIDNLHPLFRRRGVMTFFFGLVHGFGFAGALAELDLPRAAFAWALLRFNFGIELGQLAIVLVAIGALYGLRRTAAYPRLAIGGGSLAAMAFGALWFIERTAGLSLLPL